MAAADHHISSVLILVLPILNGFLSRWLLGTAGFAIPAIGLSLYIHYGYDVDLNGMVSESIYPTEVFRYLPIYTTVAGGIGFAIGWIAGRNV